MQTPPSLHPNRAPFVPTIGRTQGHALVLGVGGLGLLLSKGTPETLEGTLSNENTHRLSVLP